MRAGLIPRNIRDPLDQFHDVFTKPSLESLQQMTLAVINCQKSRNVMNLHGSLSDNLRKSRTAYEYFFNQGKWSDAAVAQRKADLFFEILGVGDGDTIRVITDDTYKGKKREATTGAWKYTGTSFLT